MKKTVLLIDDNKYLLDIFVIRLTMHQKNCRILTARNAKEGIEILRSTPVEFALIDLDKPEMDGFWFIEEAKQQFPAVPVFAMTNSCSAEIGERLRAHGITDCIEKPFLVEEVAYRIANRLKASLAALGRERELAAGRL